MTTDPQTARYRHRTTEVEAVQWTGSNADQLRAFCGPDFDEIEPEDRTENPDASAALRESKHGTWRGLEPGYWVVKIGEEFYEESPADFATQFEPVPSAVPAPTADRAVGVTDAIRTFPFDNFGMDDVSFALEDDPEAQEWVPALADAVLATLPATAAQAVELRDYWHAEAMSATTRIIELEGQLEESRRAAAEPAADLPAVVPAGAGEEPADETSCPGFPDGCPTLIAVVPTVGSTHGGGLRCGCYDEPKEAAGHCIVAYRSTGARVLRCPSCYPDETTFREGDLHPVTSEDLPDGGLCTKCGVDVLIPQEPRP